MFEGSVAHGIQKKIDGLNYKVHQYELRNCEFTKVAGQFYRNIRQVFQSRVSLKSLNSDLSSGNSVWFSKDSQEYPGALIPCRFALTSVGRNEYWLEIRAFGW